MILVSSYNKYGRKTKSKMKKEQIKKKHGFYYFHFNKVTS